MATKCFLLLAILIFSSCIVIAQRGTTTPVRELSKKAALDPTMKKPDCFKDIPSIDKMKPTHLFTPTITFPGTGEPGDVDGSSGPPKYVPGNDDTFLPNPGFEVPISEGGVPIGNGEP